MAGCSFPLPQLFLGVVVGEKTDAWARSTGDEMLLS